MNSHKPLYISYSWGGDSSYLVTKLTERFQSIELSYKLDKEQLAQREDITAYMNEIGNAEAALIVLNDKYLRSEFCMYELNQIFLKSDCSKEIFTSKLYFLILQDTAIYYAEEKQVYLKFWKQKLESLSPDSKAYERTYQIFQSLDAVLTIISSLNIPQIEPITCDIKALSLDIKRWINQVSEPSLDIIKRILNSNFEDNIEINTLNKKYPESHLLLLLETALRLRKGINFLNHELCIKIWNKLQRIIESRDALCYKTAYCFLVILAYEYFAKWKISTPQKNLSYALSKADSQLMPEFLLGIELNHKTHSIIKEIHRNY